jgi:hypothetical protein
MSAPAAEAASSENVPIALDVYPSLSGYICNLHVDRDFVLPPSASAVAASSSSSKRGGGGEVHNIVVLDISGSMGQHVQRLITKVLPLVYAKIDAASGSTTEAIHLLAFDNACTNDKIRVADLVKSTLKARGGTYMASAVKTLHKLLDTLDPSIPVRLLTLSDGEIMDGPAARAAAIDLARMVKDRSMVGETLELRACKRLPRFPASYAARLLEQP